MKGSGKVRKALTVILVLIAVCCGAYLIWYYAVSDRVNDSYDKARDTARGSVENTDAGSLDTEPVENPIDFASLQAINPDVYAWITIEGTNVDYPVVQRTDDDNYYCLLYTSDAADEL